MFTLQLAVSFETLELRRKSLRVILSIRVETGNNGVGFEPFLNLQGFHRAKIDCDLLPDKKVGFSY